MPRAFGAVLAADAVGNLTPLGLLASEPTKVLLLRGVVPTGPALTSVALDNAFYTGSVVLMLAAGAWMLTVVTWRSCCLWSAISSWPVTTSGTTT